MFIQRKKHQAKDGPQRSKYSGKCRRKGFHRLAVTLSETVRKVDYKSRSILQ